MREADDLVVPNVKKCGALTYPEPLGPSRRPVVEETFTLFQYGEYRVENCTHLLLDIQRSGAFQHKCVISSLTGLANITLKDKFNFKNLIQYSYNPIVQPNL